MRGVLLALTLATLLTACGQPGSDGPAVAELSSPAGAGSVAPNLARGPDGRIYLSWIEPAGSGHRLVFSEFRDGGWLPPLEIARGANWFVNWADFPALLPLGGGRLAAHWLVRSGPGTYAYDIHVGLSMDEGRSWQALGPIHDDATETEHGFVSFYAYKAGDGTLWPALVWLDGRNMAGVHGGHESHAEASGMTLRHARIRPDGKVEEALELDELTCDCCQTAAVGVGNEVLVAYRDRSEAEIRDIRLIRRDAGGWQDQGRLFADGWQVSGCPVNGPSLDALEDRVAIVWFTGADDRPMVKFGMSRDAGRNFEFYDLESGNVLGRVDVAMAADGGAASWLAASDEGATIRLQMLAADGSPMGRPATVIESDASRGSGFPRLLASGGEFLLAWTDVNSKPSRVRTVKIQRRR